jgi:predicted DNA-binding transcriptional regulator YafY
MSRASRVSTDAARDAQSATSDTAAAQLRRLLHVIPRIADGQEHPIARLARIAGVEDNRQLIADLESLVDRFDMPGGFVEGVQVWIDSKTVSVVSDHFRRPMRLTMPELCALQLGLAVLRSERPPSEHAVFERTLERLRRIITVLPQNSAQEDIRAARLDGPGDRTQLAAVRKALFTQHRIRIEYRGGNAHTSAWRTICPYGILFASGAWYVAAHCDSSDGLRFFRLDRIEATEPTNDPYTIPPEFTLDSLAGNGQVLDGTPITMMQVRYSARIARWIAERDGMTLESDGTLVVDHPVHDVEWAIRHVMQYGPDAEIITPPEMRTEMVRRLVAIRDENAATGAVIAP